MDFRVDKCKKGVLYYNCKVKELKNSFLLISLIPISNNYILKDIQNKLSSFTLYAYKNSFKYLFSFSRKGWFLMKRTKKLLASILASSLAVMSLPFFGLSASAGSEMVMDTTEIVKESSQTYYELISISSFDRFSYLYCNPETKTAFTIPAREFPDTLYWLLEDEKRFDDGMTCILPASTEEFKFPNAEITIAGDSMYVVNHGAIVYVDDNGEEHSFSSFSDVEQYVIQNYNVTLVDYEEVKDDNKVEYPEQTWIELVDVVKRFEDSPHKICLYHNGDTKTAFEFSTADLPNELQLLINCSDTFDDGVVYGTSSKNKTLKFPNAEITDNGTFMSAVNHGSIVFVDDNGEEHPFSGFSDLENYVIQNYDVTVVDYNKYVEDGSIVPIDATPTPVNNTTAPSYFTGDVTGNGAVDLMDAISLNKIFAGMITPTNVQTTAADINQDGSVTDEDLSILMQFLIGIRTDLTDVD